MDYWSQQSSKGINTDSVVNSVSACLCTEPSYQVFLNSAPYLFNSSVCDTTQAYI